jgi:hypothetical protein
MQTRIALVALFLAVLTFSTASGEMSHMLTFSCNADGTYTCGASCQVEPYKGIGCCAMAS